MRFDQCACTGQSLARLLHPILLALLARQPGHGYKLATRLAALDMFGDDPPDTSGVYKALKGMEKEGLLSSSWESGDAGPARCSYALTERGLACLRQWITTLQDHRARLDEVLALLRDACP